MVKKITHRWDLCFNFYHLYFFMTFKSTLRGGMLQQLALLAAGAQPWHHNICTAHGRRFAYAATLAIYVYEVSASFLLTEKTKKKSGQGNFLIEENLWALEHISLIFCQQMVWLLSYSWQDYEQWHLVWCEIQCVIKWSCHMPWIMVSQNELFWIFFCLEFRYIFMDMVCGFHQDHLGSYIGRFRHVILHITFLYVKFHSKYSFEWMKSLLLYI